MHCIDASDFVVAICLHFSRFRASRVAHSHFLLFQQTDQTVPSARSGHSLVIANHTALVFGGGSIANPALSDSWAYYRGCPSGYVRSALFASNGVAECTAHLDLRSLLAMRSSVNRLHVASVLAPGSASDQATSACAHVRQQTEGAAVDSCEIIPGLLCCPFSSQHENCFVLQTISLCWRSFGFRRLARTPTRDWRLLAYDSVRLL